MGFLDKLFGGSKKTPEAPTYAQPEVMPDYLRSFDTGDEYFENIITEQNFEGFAIEKDVAVQRFDDSAHPACYKISYLFSKDGEPRLAVFIMNTNQYRSYPATGAYKVLEQNGIPYLRFFKGMKNEQDYVISRIGEQL